MELEDVVKFGSFSDFSPKKQLCSIAYQDPSIVVVPSIKNEGALALEPCHSDRSNSDLQSIGTSVVDRIGRIVKSYSLMFNSNATSIDERENHFRSSKLSSFNNPGVMKQARKFAASIDA